MLKLFAYILCVLWLNMFCVLCATTSNVDRHPHHHRTHHNNHHRQQHQQHRYREQAAEKTNYNNHHHRHNNNSNLHRHRIDFYYGSLSRTWNSQSNIGGSRINKIPNQVPNEHTINASSTMLPIVSPTTTTGKTPVKPLMTNPLKLTLIQTNGNSFVQTNNYPHAFNNRHFYRWPIASTTKIPPQSDAKHHHHTDFDIKWRTGSHNNGPFVPNFNPTIESIPIAPTTATSHSRRAFADQPIHSKHHTNPGRHVCVEYKTYMLPLQQSQTENQLRMPASCRNTSQCLEYSGLLFDSSNMIPQRRTNHAVYNCCPGWAKINKHSHGCTKPICKIPCKNNGKCVKPEICTCPAGYQGKHCEIDVNECVTEKPCDQTCYNTDGSFYCTCRLGFVLREDKQSCKKIDSSFGNDDTGTAFEARDLENDIDTDNDLATRMQNIEKLIITEKERNLETNKLMHNTLAAVSNLKHRLDSLENRQNELNLLRDRLKSYELQANKIEYTMDLLFKCRHKPLIYCP